MRPTQHHVPYPRGAGGGRRIPVLHPVAPQSGAGPCAHHCRGRYTPRPAPIHLRPSSNATFPSSRNATVLINRPVFLLCHMDLNILSNRLSSPPMTPVLSVSPLSLSSIATNITAREVPSWSTIRCSSSTISSARRIKGLFVASEPASTVSFFVSITPAVFPSSPPPAYVPSLVQAPRGGRCRLTAR